jgi:hypothetical protein
MSIVVLSGLDWQPAILAAWVIKGNGQIVENGRGIAFKPLETGIGCRSKSRPQSNPAI